MSSLFTKYGILPSGGGLSKIWIASGVNNYSSANHRSLTYSSDGITWTVLDITTGFGMQTIAYSGDKEIMVGSITTGQYFQYAKEPLNIASWTAATKTNGYNRIIYANGKFIAGGNSDLIYSTDGMTWTTCTASIYRINDVAFGNSYYIAVGETDSGLGYPDLFYSTDGINWTRKATGATWGSPALNVVCHDGTRFVAAGDTTTRVYTSTNGYTWADESCTIHGVPISLVYGNGKYVMVGDSGYIDYSTDHLTWTKATCPVTTKLYRVAYGNGLFVAVGVYGVILTSPDGITWTQRTSGFGTTSSSYINDIVYIP